MGESIGHPPDVHPGVGGDSSSVVYRVDRRIQRRIATCIDGIGHIDLVPDVAVEIACNRRGRESACTRIIRVRGDVQTIARGIGVILDVDVDSCAVIPRVGSLVDLVGRSIAIAGGFRLEVELEGEDRSRTRSRWKSQAGRVRRTLTGVVVGVG